MSKSIIKDRSISTSDTPWNRILEWTELREAFVEEDPPVSGSDINNLETRGETKEETRETSYVVHISLIM